MATATQIKAPDSNLDQLCINSIRVLAIDAVLKANSGHPGMPIGFTVENVVDHALKLLAR